MVGERTNDRNPLGSARRARRDFGMIRLESSGSDYSMGMSFRGNSVNPSYTPFYRNACGIYGVKAGKVRCRGMYILVVRLAVGISIV